MSFDYAAMAATATRLLNRFGADRTYTAYTNGSYDPVSGTTPKTESNYTLKTVKTDFSAQERSLGAINTGDVNLFVEPGGNAPEVGDTVDLSGAIYEIVNVEQVKPADTVVLFILQARR